MSGLGVGTILGGTYELQSRIGRGGMGAVWVAQHLRLPKRVAVKVLHVMPDEDSVAFARFRREAEISSRLGHPNIVRILDFNIHENGAPYIVMELLSGQSLKSAIAAGPMPPERALPIVRQIATALNVAHLEGVIHRDLKPENVFLTPRDSGSAGPEDHVTVLDFGISKILGSQSVQTRANAVMGTPQYMSPEQAAGEGAHVGPAADQFALGALTYELLSGVSAFSGDHVASVVYKVLHQEPRPLSSHAPKLSEGVVVAVHRALAKKPAERHPSLNEFITRLTGVPLVTIDTWSDPVENELSLDGTTYDGMLEADADLASPVEASEALCEGGSSDAVEPQPPTPVSLPPATRWLWPMVVGLTAILMLGSLFPWGEWFGQPLSYPASPTAAAPTPIESSAEPSQPMPLSLPIEPAKPKRKRDLSVARRAPDSARGRARVGIDETLPKRRTVTRPARVSIPAAVKADLQRAQSALSGGRWDSAIHLAKRANRKVKTSTAASVIVRAYCGKKDLGNARSWMFELSRADRSTVRAFCRSRGYDLR